MRLPSAAFWCLMLGACCKSDPAIKPSRDPDPNDPQVVLASAIHNTRSQKSYELTYKARLSSPARAVDYAGRCVWVSPGILYIQYQTPGHDDKKVIRAGEKDVWVYHPLSEDWYTAEEVGLPSVARGINNPDEVLAILERYKDTPRLLKPGVIEVTIDGNDLAEILKNYFHNLAINPRDSSARLELTLDRQSRLQKVTFDATVSGMRITAKAIIVGYNEALEIKFTDDKDRPIFLGPEMRAKMSLILSHTSKEVSRIEALGFVRENRQRMISLTGIKIGEVLTQEKKKLALTELYKTGKFETVEISEMDDPTDPNRIIVRISVIEK